VRGRIDPIERLRRLQDSCTAQGADGAVATGALGKRCTCRTASALNH